MNKCLCCDVEKTLDQFTRNAKRKSGLSAYCRMCSKEKRAAYARRYADGKNTPSSKCCRVCSECKPISEFYGDAARKDLHGDNCRECVKSRMAEYTQRPEVKERHRIAVNIDYHRNPERRRAYDKTPHGKYGDYKSDAKRRRGGMEFSLTKDEFMLFWQKPCFYCGDPIETVGLDRVDNSRGYILGNVVSCCRICNLAKRDLGRDEFIAHCKKIAAKAEVKKDVLR